MISLFVIYMKTVQNDIFGANPNKYPPLLEISIFLITKLLKNPYFSVKTQKTPFFKIEIVYRKTLIFPGGLAIFAKFCQICQIFCCQIFCCQILPNFLLPNFTKLYCVLPNVFLPSQMSLYGCQIYIWPMKLIFIMLKGVFWLTNTYFTCLMCFL